MSNTPPYFVPEPNQHETHTDTIDTAAINTFDQRINICVVCTNCVAKDNIPSCSNVDLPLVVVIEQQECPIGAW